MARRLTTMDYKELGDVFQKLKSGAKCGWMKQLPDGEFKKCWHAPHTGKCPVRGCSCPESTWTLMAIGPRHDY